MTDPSDHGGLPPSRPSGAGNPLPIGRVALVLILFIIATAELLGQVHPSVPTTSSATSTTSSTAKSSTTTPKTSTTTPKTSTTTTTVPPSKVAVLSANGSTVTGAATTLADQLHAIGWVTLPPVNATTNVTASTVYYAPGFEPSAAAIAGMLHLAPTAVQPIGASVPVASTAGADVVVVLGPDAAGKTISTTTTTTTTPPPATTTTTKEH